LVDREWTRSQEGDHGRVARKNAHLSVPRRRHYGGRFALVEDSRR
jgi:hypothetical protein